YHERMIMLSVLDGLWKDHLLSMDHLKEGIGLRGYGQHDPLVEYKRESFDMFEEMMQRFQEETVRYLYLMQIMERPPDAAPRTGGDGSGLAFSSDGCGLIETASALPIVPGGHGDNGRRPRNVATAARPHRLKKIDRFSRHQFAVLH